MLTRQELTLLRWGHLRWQPVAGHEPNPPRGLEDRGHSIPAPREQCDLPTHRMSQLGLSAAHPRACNWPSRGTQTTGEHFSLMLSSIPILLLGSLWKVKDRSSKKSKQNPFVCLHCAHVPSPALWSPRLHVRASSTVVSRLSGDDLCYWLMCSGLFSLCVVERISRG